MTIYDKLIAAKDYSKAIIYLVIELQHSLRSAEPLAKKKKKKS